MDETRLGPDFMKALKENLPYFLEGVERSVFPAEPYEVEVSRLELIAVLLLKKSKILNMSGLAQGLSVPMSTATGIAERLEKKGLICRVKSSEDRRSINLELRDEGVKLIDEYLNHVESLISGWKSNLTDEEFEIFSILLRKMLVVTQTSDWILRVGK